MYTLSDFKWEYPLLRPPACILIDDPTPGVNPLFQFASQVPPGSKFYHYYSSGGRWYFTQDESMRHPIAERVDPSFIHEFASVIKSNGVKGKMSVIPCPGGIGRIDRSLMGVPDQVREDFIRVVRDELGSNLDVSPELITHTNAFDITRGVMRSDLSEHEWSQSRSVEELTEYVSYAFEVLRSAGLVATGVTSPCDFGAEVEGEYAEAIRRASKRINDANVAWYFLRVDEQSLNVSPRLVILDREHGEAVVSIVSATGDPFWSSQLTDEPFEEWVGSAVDPMVSGDGGSGRLVDLVRYRSPVVMLTHWQSLYSNGTRFGLKALDELLKRFNTHLGEDIIWMKCSELASYVACTHNTEYRVLDGGRLIRVSTPFTCRLHTVSFHGDPTPRRVSVDDVDAERVEKPSELAPGKWTLYDGRVVVVPPESAKGEHPHTWSISLD